VLTAFGGTGGVSHRTGSLVVHIDQGGAEFFYAQFIEDGSPIFDRIATGNDHDELHLGGAGADHNNPLISHGRPVHTEDFGAT
jgi:hypothetical protein